MRDGRTIFRAVLTANSRAPERTMTMRACGRRAPVCRRASCWTVLVRIPARLSHPPDSPVTRTQRRTRAAFHPMLHFGAPNDQLRGGASAAAPPETSDEFPIWRRDSGLLATATSAQSSRRIDSDTSAG
ncbi:unnamed protein product [Diplocarpon coronariae]|nr:hypothetical protein JHW43_006843 [Diplocarpon mali]